ncbi:hypothetical protein M5689_003267 [Euphorbia peplus]|nr:hypothetical protein M5689_003267 [Euphorbia peplus]
MDPAHTGTRAPRGTRKNPGDPPTRSSWVPAQRQTSSHGTNRQEPQAHTRGRRGPATQKKRQISIGQSHNEKVTKNQESENTSSHVSPSTYRRTGVGFFDPPERVPNQCPTRGKSRYVSLPIEGRGRRKCSQAQTCETESQRKYVKRKDANIRKSKYLNDHRRSDGHRSLTT